MINEALVAIGETPIIPAKLKQKTYPHFKAKKIQQSLTTHLGLETKSSDFDVMIDQMKHKFNASTRSEKLQLLTLLPSTWSVRRIENEFETSNFMARTAKRLAAEKGILSSPNPKQGRSLAADTVQQVRLFYEDDNISRAMPGMKDTVSVRVDGKKFLSKRD